MSKRRQSIRLSEILPKDLPAHLTDGSRIGLGLDIATTEKETSNPSSLALTEQVGRDYIVRLLWRWKTADPEITLAILRSILHLISPRVARALCVDATSERYFAARIRRELAGIVPVKLIVSSESTEYLGERMTFKVYLNNLLINTLEDGRMVLPNQTWVRDDFRLVKRSKGTFVTDTDDAGNHGDSFDAVKQSLHALIGAGGPVTAGAAHVGSFGAGTATRPGIQNPYAHLFNPTFKINA